MGRIDPEWVNGERRFRRGCQRPTFERRSMVRTPRKGTQPRAAPGSMPGLAPLSPTPPCPPHQTMGDVKPQYPTLPKLQTPHFYGAHKAPVQQNLGAGRAAAPRPRRAARLTGGPRARTLPASQSQRISRPSPEPRAARPYLNHSRSRRIPSPPAAAARAPAADVRPRYRGERGSS